VAVAPQVAELVARRVDPPRGPFSSWCRPSGAWRSNGRAETLRRAWRKMPPLGLITSTVDTYGKWLPMADRAVVSSLDDPAARATNDSNMVAGTSARSARRD
jgi:hypothetical protein